MGGGSRDEDMTDEERKRRDLREEARKMLEEISGRARRAPNAPNPSNSRSGKVREDPPILFDELERIAQTCESNADAKKIRRLQSYWLMRRAQPWRLLGVPSVTATKYETACNRGVAEACEARGRYRPATLEHRLAHVGAAQYWRTQVAAYTSQRDGLIAHPIVADAEGSLYLDDSNRVAKRQLGVGSVDALSGPGDFKEVDRLISHDLGPDDRYRLIIAPDGALSTGDVVKLRDSVRKSLAATKRVQSYSRSAPAEHYITIPLMVSHAPVEDDLHALSVLEPRPLDATADIVVRVTRDGFDIERGGNQFTPIEGCADSGVTVCLQQGDSVDDLVAAIDAGRASEDKKQLRETVSKLVARYQLAALYSQLQSIHTSDSEATVSVVVDAALPFDLAAKTLSAVNIKRENDSYEDDIAFFADGRSPGHLFESFELKVRE